MLVVVCGLGSELYASQTDLQATIKLAEEAKAKNIVRYVPTSPSSRKLAVANVTLADGSYVIPPKCLLEAATVALSGTVLLATLTALVPALGFEEEGVATESIAAAWQSTMGTVEKDSLFAKLQSLAARGELLEIMKTGLPVVGNLAAASAVFCTEVEAIPGNAGEALANTTGDIIKQLQGIAAVAPNATTGALDQIQEAANWWEGAVHAAGEAVDDA